MGEIIFLVIALLVTVGAAILKAIYRSRLGPVIDSGCKLLVYFTLALLALFAFGAHHQKNDGVESSVSAPAVDQPSAIPSPQKQLAKEQMEFDDANDSLNTVYRQLWVALNLSDQHRLQTDQLKWFQQRRHYTDLHQRTSFTNQRVREFEQRLSSIHH